MTLTLRLTPHLRQQLEIYCKERGLSKSRVVTALLSEYLSASSRSGRTPYQRAREFGMVGGFASGKGDLAEKRKRYLVQKLRAKPKLPLGERLRAILQGLPDDPTFEPPEQPPLERDAQWWALHGFAPLAKRAARRPRSRAKR